MKCDKCGKELTSKGFSGSYLIATLDTNEEMICCNEECWEELSKEVSSLYDGKIVLTEISFDMDKDRLIDLLNRYDLEGNLNETEYLELFSYLIKSNMLQGHYGREAELLVQNGSLDIYGNILI